MKDTIKNCLYTDMENGFYFPRRFTTKQYEHYSIVTEKSLARSLGCASVCLEFVTDEPGFSFDFTLKEPSEHPASFDVYENGVYYKTYTFAEADVQTFTHKLFNKERTHIIVYFPNLREVGVRGLEAGNYEVPKRKGNILFLGSSITQGTNIKHPSMSYASILGRFFGANILNQGVSGRIYDIACFDYGVGYEPESIIIGYGGNDYRSPASLEMLETEIDTYLEAVRKRFPSANVYIAAPLWRRDVAESAENEARFISLLGIIGRLSEKYCMTLLDTMNILPRLKEFYADELVHPNEMGHYMLALEIVRYMLGQKR